MEKLEIGNFCCFILDILIFMPPTLKKLWSILVSACLSIRCYKLGLSGFVFVPNTFMWLNEFVWLVRLHHFYAPNFEKVGGTYWFRLVPVCVCVCVCVRMGQRDIILKLHVWIPHGIIADTYFFLNYLPL